MGQSRSEDIENMDEVKCPICGSSQISAKKNGFNTGLIVSIPDTFEASIQVEEAQLKLSEKQYEYYRNKLLTFAYYKDEIQ